MPGSWWRPRAGVLHVGIPPCLLPPLYVRQLAFVLPLGGSNNNKMLFLFLHTGAHVWPAILSSFKTSHVAAYQAQRGAPRGKSSVLIGVATTATGGCIVNWQFTTVPGKLV